MKDDKKSISLLLSTCGILALLSFVVLLLVAVTGTFYLYPAANYTFTDSKTVNSTGKSEPVAVTETDEVWRAPALSSLAGNPEEKSITYGRELIAHTAKYLGPEGSVLQISNGMNCQNCHLDAGTKIFGNNYSRVFSTYPKFRKRSGSEEDIYKRINDCLERSLNGKPLPLHSEELKAMAAYINWVGRDVKKGDEPEGAGLYEIALLDRAASPEKGKLVYEARCQTCHSENGQGQKKAGATEYLYPPLYGDNSYNVSAGLYRISNFAKFVKANMPLGATYDKPILSDEEAWDVAAYVNSMPRPQKTFKQDWPEIADKPFDHPFGPYADAFTEKQHKYGPFQEIKQAQKKKAL